MKLIDIAILVIILGGIVLTIYLMRKNQKKGCSGTCLGCGKSEECNIKNLKAQYDKDKKTMRSN